MKHFIIIISVLLTSFVSATAYSENEYLAYMSKAEWLIISNEKDGVNLQIHLPRIASISEVSWSYDKRYMTFTTKQRELWLLDLKHGAISLVESVPSTHPEVNYLPQWSANTSRFLFVSHKYSQSRARVYSTDKKHSYALPIAFNEASSFTWSDEDDVIKVSGFTGSPKRLTASTK